MRQWDGRQSVLANGYWMCCSNHKKSKARVAARGASTGVETGSADVKQESLNRLNVNLKVLIEFYCRVLFL